MQLTEARNLGKNWARACGNCEKAEEFQDPEAAKSSVYCPVLQSANDRFNMTCMSHFEPKKKE